MILEYFLGLLTGIAIWRAIAWWAKRRKRPVSVLVSYQCGTIKGPRHGHVYVKQLKGFTKADLCELEETISLDLFKNGVTQTTPLILTSVTRLDNDR